MKEETYSIGNSISGGNEMTTLKDSLDNIQDAAQTIMKEIKSVRKSVANLESMKEVKELEKSINKLKSAISGGEASVSQTKAAPKRGESGKVVMNLVEKSKEGISVGEIKNATGLSYGTINKILNEAKKEKKVKSPKRGVYIKA